MPLDRTTTRPTRAQIAARTRRDNRARLVARILTLSPHEDRSVGLNPTLLVQAMLPHSERYLVGEDDQRVLAPLPGGTSVPLLAPTFSTTNGRVTLSVRAGTKLGPTRHHPDVSRGIPYGGLGRLLLSFVVTEARKRRSRSLCLGATLATFCEQIAVTPSGGEHGRARYVTDQLQRLATAVLDIRIDGADPRLPGRTHESGESVLVVDSYRFWNQAASNASEETVGGEITLSERFWTDVARSCFPIDLRKAQLFRARPLAYDLYLWLTYRLGRLERSGRPHVALNYDQLHAQLGSHYRTDDHGRLTPEAKKNFAYKVRAAIRAVRGVWPRLDVAFPRGRIVLHATGPDVAHRAPRA